MFLYIEGTTALSRSAREWYHPQVGPIRKCCHIQKGLTVILSKLLATKRQHMAKQIYCITTCSTSHTRKIFSLLYNSAMAFHFPWEICFYLLSFELFICEHGYTIHLGLVINTYCRHTLIFAYLYMIQI
jgi:hypothetical protein